MSLAHTGHGQSLNIPRFSSIGCFSGFFALSLILFTSPASHFTSHSSYCALRFLLLGQKMLLSGGEKFYE
jgi:hypothetical protein